MFRFLLVFGLTLLSAQAFSQQQTITSRGDRNTNINMKGLVNVVVSGDPETEAALHAASKHILGSSNLWRGVLVPAADKLADSCTKKIADSGQLMTSLPTAIIGVRAGSNEFQCTHLPCNIVRTNEHELLAIDGKPGAITVEAKILDENGDIIVSIEKGQFYVNPNRTYRSPVRDNKSSLKVFDMKGNTVLEMRYANRHTLLVQQAIFHDGVHRMLKIEPARIHLEYSHHSGNIAGECDVQFDDNGHSGFFTSQIGDFFFGGSPK